MVIKVNEIPYFMKDGELKKLKEFYNKLLYDKESLYENI